MYNNNARLGSYGIAEYFYEKKILKPITGDNGQILPSVHFCGVMGAEKFDILNESKVGVPNPSGLTETFGITAVVTLTMMLLSSFFPDFFASNTMGKILGITLLVTIIIELILLITGAGSLGIIDYIVVLIFCGYIGYDWAKANMGEKTVDKAVDAAAMLYVDIANLFLRIMRILARAQR